MDKILEKSVKNLFLGLIAGDGDVFSRMASSHEGASPAYPEPLAGIVSAIKIDFDQGKFAKLQSDEDFDEAIKPYFESFAQTYSPENFPTEPENNAPAGDVRFAARYLARSIGLTWIGNRSFYRAKNCKKGIACGNTCIAKNRVCKQNLPPAVAAQVPPAKAKTKKAAGGATTAPAAPAAPSAPAPAPDPADLLFGPKKPKKPKAKKTAPSPDTASDDGYKPFMTRAEAAAYTKDSYYGNRVFYHGTGSAGADKITKGGVDPTKTRTALYGKGFYMTPVKDEANNYARFESNPERLGVMFNVKKPFVVEDLIDLKSRLQKEGICSRDAGPTKIRQALMKAGYDAIEVTNVDYFVAFEGKQVAVFEKKKVETSRY